MCYGFLGLFSFGDCNKSAPQSIVNISLTDIRKDIYNTISVINQSDEDNIIASQFQNVSIIGYPPGAPDIDISQIMELKVASSSKLSSTIDDTLLLNFSKNMQDQLDNFLASRNEFTSNLDNMNAITNMKKDIARIINSESTKRNIQKKLSTTINIQNQNVMISFAQNIPKLIKDEVTMIYGKDGRPLIKINQKLVNTIQSETIISSLINELFKDESFVENALRVKANNNQGNNQVTSPLLKSQLSLSIANNNKSKNILWLSIIIIIFLIIIFYYVYKK